VHFASGTVTVEVLVDVIVEVAEEVMTGVFVIVEVTVTVLVVKVVVDFRILVTGAGVNLLQDGAAVAEMVRILAGPEVVTVLVFGCTSLEHALETTSQTKPLILGGRSGMRHAAGVVAARR